jgi:hypothetical protein
VVIVVVVAVVETVVVIYELCRGIFGFQAGQLNCQPSSKYELPYL